MRPEQGINLKIRRPGIDPEAWVELAHVEADEHFANARGLLVVITIAISVAITIAIVYGLQPGWIILAAFIGVMIAIGATILPVMRRLDAGRRYIEQAETTHYLERHQIDL